MEGLDFAGVIESLLENALAEARRGHCRTIELELSEHSFRVQDDGRGLPVHPHPQSGRRLLEVILTGARRESKNTLARVNAVCTWLEVEVHRDGELWHQRFEFSQPVSPPELQGPTARSGTVLAGAPVLGEPPSFESLRDLVRRRALNEEGVKVQVRISDSRIERNETIVIA